MERRYSDCGCGRFGKLDASEIHPRRIKAKEVWISQKRDEFIFPVAHGTAKKMSARDYDLRQPTLRRKDLNGELQGEPEGFQPTETKDDAEACADFWYLQGDFIYRHHNVTETYTPTELHVAGR